jgi:molybdate transport system substrate-binding protein
MRARRFLFLFALILPAWAAGGQPLTVAVASNFQQTAREIGLSFEDRTGVAVRISAGSTGKLYGQIVNGAPFDVFLAADADRPQRLEASGHGIVGTRRTYAIGSLVLWSRDPGLVGHDCRDALESLDNRKLALANPRTAPYGRAAREFLQAAGLWESVEPSLVFGENASQALQFVATGNARFGLVAASQTLAPELPEATCAWSVPQELHAPLEQQAIVLQRATGNDYAMQFVEFLLGDYGRGVITDAGYLLPQQDR